MADTGRPSPIILAYLARGEWGRAGVHGHGEVGLSTCQHGFLGVL